MGRGRRRRAPSSSISLIWIPIFATLILCKSRTEALKPVRYEEITVPSPSVEVHLVDGPEPQMQRVKLEYQPRMDTDSCNNDPVQVPDGGREAGVV